MTGVQTCALPIFEPVAPEKVEWQAVFLEKTKEDIVVELTEEVAGAMEKGESQ